MKWNKQLNWMQNNWETYVKLIPDMMTYISFDYDYWDDGNERLDAIQLENEWNDWREMT